MKYTLVIKEEAYEDLQTAYDYYEDESPGLGERFLNSVKERIAYINMYPLHFNPVAGGFRQTLINKFPFLIVYEFADSEIVVYAIFHCSRNPAKKFRK